MERLSQSALTVIIWDGRTTKSCECRFAPKIRYILVNLQEAGHDVTEVGVDALRGLLLDQLGQHLDRSLTQDATNEIMEKMYNKIADDNRGYQS